MGFLDKLFGKKEKAKALSNEQIIEAGACPNCWGQSEYDGQYIKAVEERTKSNINGDKLHQKAFIQQFIETNVTGIRLKKDGDQQYCPVCKSKYKHVSSHAN